MTIKTLESVRADFEEEILSIARVEDEDSMYPFLKNSNLDLIVAGDLFIVNRPSRSNK